MIHKMLRDSLSGSFMGERNSREETLNAFRRWHTDMACVCQSSLTVAKHDIPPEGGQGSAPW